ncbi:MAG: arginine--tRNA ligase, partial [Cyanobacteria bacterium J06641_5]
MPSTLTQLQHRTTQALVAAFGSDVAAIDPMVAPAAKPEFGDYQANVAMSLAKKLGQKPRAIAQQIVDKLDVADLCEPPTIAGPGFINFKLSPQFLNGQVAQLQADPR